jgi:uracil-DNA glycosylase
MSPLDDLLPEILACRLCEEHLPLGPRPVLQVHEDARILIVGQAPGTRVHESGKPFDDPSGVRLRQWLGVTPEEFYDPAKIAIVPMGFCYPGTGKSGDLPPRPECAQTWRQPVLEALPNIELTIVLGMYARRWHLDSPHRRLSDVVADWETFWPSHLPLPHPSPRNQRWFRQHAWFETEILPVLKARIRDLISS